MPAPHRGRLRTSVHWANRTRSALQNRIGAELTVGLLLSIGALIFFAWLAAEVLEGDTQQFDAWVRASIHQHASPPLTAIMRATTLAGSPAVLIGLGFFAAIVLIRAQQRRAVVLLCVTMAGAAALNETLKLTFRRARPAPFFLTPQPASYSFPSGHAVLAFCFYGVIAAMVTARLRSRVLRVVTWIAAVLLIAVIGFSRIYLGVHYPSDVVAGYAAAFVWVTTVTIGDRLIRRRRRPSS